MTKRKRPATDRIGDLVEEINTIPDQALTAQDRVHLELLGRAAAKYGFRATTLGESPVDYVYALIAHVETRDLAAGFELRIGKCQADWNAEEIAAFTRRMTDPTFIMPRETLPIGSAIPCMCTPGNEVSDANFLRLAEHGLDALCQMRGNDPDGTLPIIANVLLTTGELLTAAVDRDDRVAFLKVMTRTRPVFGFFLVADLWTHLVTEDQATKGEAIVVQIGTRERRLTKIRAYTRDDAGGIVFTRPHPDDVIDSKTEDGVLLDAYASIFVSVPMPTGAAS
jgi:hypothetical protein